MKTLAFITVFVLFAGSQIIAQNRVSTWDTDKITNIKFEMKSNGKIEKSILFTEQEQMDKILEFLRSIEFKETNDVEIIEQSNSKDWISRFIFKGQRDWVIFFKNTATIGKTTFWIEKDINEKVKKLIEGLEIR